MKLLHCNEFDETKTCSIEEAIKIATTSTFAVSNQYTMASEGAMLRDVLTRLIIVLHDNKVISNRDILKILPYFEEVQ